MQIRHYLKRHLPAQMQPTAFVKLKEIPRTVTGKVDKLKLPKPEASDFCYGQGFIRPYDNIELKLKDIWLDLLQLPSIGICDDFFLAGGHSLAAVYLMTRINGFFKVQHPVAWVSQYRTIRAQAEQIRKEEKICCGYDPIVQFGTSQNNSVADSDLVESCLLSETPLVFIHPALAGAEVYGEIADHLGKRVRFYAIDSYNLNSGNSYLKTIESLALEYIGYLRQIKPIGPYLLGGWSFGGMIAYEMAQQLRKMGEVVSKIYLIDGHILNRGYMEDLYNVAEVTDLIEAVSEDWMEYLKILPKKYLEKVFSSFQNDIKMIMQYKISCYDGPVMLLKSTNFKTTKFLKLHKIIINNMHNNWKSFAKNLEMSYIYSDHFSLIEGKTAREVAGLIEKDIVKLTSDRIYQKQLELT